MKLRVFICLGLLVAMVRTGNADVRVVVKDGRRLIYNDGPAKIGSSEEWLASRVQRASAYDNLIAAAARESSIDPKLVKSVMLVESGFNPGAVSRKGARGLMQLMPEVASRQGVHNIHDPAQNIAAGVRHLSHLLGVYGGDVIRSLAAYNAGEAAVERYDGIPPYDETQLYVRKTLAAYYGGSVLGGGFGKPPTETFRGIPATKGRPVNWLRDSRTNRVILTTKGHPAARRIG
jgi:soluble lytic murein transglycosylase-like protein